MLLLMGSVKLQVVFNYQFLKMCLFKERETERGSESVRQPV